MPAPEFTRSPDLAGLWPLAVGRPPGELPLAGRDLRVWQQWAWMDADGSACWQREDAWIGPVDAALLGKAEPGTSLVAADGTQLAGKHGAASGETMLTSDSRLLAHPWDLLALNEERVGALDRTSILGFLSPAATLDGLLVLGEGSRILPGVYIEGKVIIGNDCKIGPNCYIRGHTSIGHGCHIGQAVEIKNSLIGNKTNAGHLSYIGDSILGDGVNLGAGTITSNFRHDGGHHRSMAHGKLVSTGRRKFGAVFGDGVHTGIHTSIYPGRKLGPHVTTLPGAIVQRDLT
jgi:bifunctional UDP-N-acetylglucosamine pyrophosphorylase/glucosamine-1-phosphate N-acetyltransferase